MTAWCGRGGIGGPPPALFGPPPGPPPPPRWPLRGLGRYAARSGRPAHPGGPSGPLCGPLRPLAGPPGSGGPSGPPPAVAPARRPPGRSVGPLRCLSGAGSAPPLRPRSSGSRFGLPGRRVPPSGAWPGGLPGLVPPRAPHPAAGGGSRPAAGWPFTAGPCSLPPRTRKCGGAVPPAAAPSACRPWHRSPSRYCSRDSTLCGPSRYLHTSP